MDPEVEAQDGSLAAAASAIDALFKTQGAPEPAAAETDLPQAAAPVQAEPVETTVTEETPSAVETTVTEPVPEPAKQPAASSPELAQKLQEAADRVQQAEAARSQFVNALNTLVPQMESAIRGEFADIKTFDDLQQVAQTDPDRYNRYVIANAKLQQAQAAQKQATEEHNRVAQDRHKQWQASEQDKLAKALPELNDPQKGPVLARKLQEFATKSGYTPQQLSMASANDFLMLNRAMSFDNLQAAQKIAQAKAAKAPPVQTPGTPRTTSSKDEKLQSDFERLQKSGRVDDAASVFRHFIT